MSKFCIGVGHAVKGGPYRVEWKQPEAFVVEKEHHDNMAASIEVIDGKWYAMVREVHLCDDYDHAARVLDALVALRTESFEQ